MATTMTAERRIAKIQIGLIRSPMFAHLSGILMVGSTRVCDTTPTAYTDGMNKVYGRKFVDKLTDKALAFVIVHEAYHVMYRHMTTWFKLWKENPQAANAAMDFVINDQILALDPNKEHVEFPTIDGKRVGLHDAKYRGLHTKQVYDMLKEEAKNGGGKGKPQPSDGSGQPGSSDGTADGGFDEHGWDAAKGMTDEEKKQVEREVDQAIRQGLIAQSRLNGTGAGNMNRDLSELLEPKIDWREVLREFVTSTCANKDQSSWRRVSRRMLADDIYLPSMIGESVGRGIVGIDMSGSVGQREATICITEVVHMMKTVVPEKIDLLYWDHVVAGHEEYDPATYDSMPNSTKPKGGGGTTPSCITKWIKEKQVKPEFAIILTDGYVGNDWGGEWPCPVLWIIVGGNKCIAPVGKTVPMKEDY